MRSSYAGTLLGLVLTVLLAGSATGQSITSIRGLGYPIVPADARSAALGGLGIGLMGLNVPMLNPAAAAGIDRRGIVVSAAAVNRRSTLGDVSGSTGATRFPLMQMVFPVGRVVLTGGYGSFLDQSWSVFREGSEPVGGATVAYRDVVQSTGGIGQARIGAAIPVGDRFALGVALARYTGGQDINIRRVFDTTSVGVLEPYSEARSFRYGGTAAEVGFRWDPIRALRVAGSVKWSGTLSADSTDGPVPSTEFELPLQIAGGASAYLAPGLLAAVSGRWSGWSVTDPAGTLADPDLQVTSQDTWELGGGLELDNPARRALRSYPIRVGFQYRQLPFSFVGDNPREWMASAGVGMRLGTSIDNPLARVDFTVQRGARTATGGGGLPDLEETVWRYALTVAIFGT